MALLRVAAFTGGITTPSARFRVRQHIPGLLHHGVAMKEMYSSFGRYPPANKWARPFWAGATLATQIPNVIKSHDYDAVLLQREMLSTFATLEYLTKKPRILDVDDAIFMHRNGSFACRLAQISDRIICGNTYLANWFNHWNSNITVIPTAIDINRYAPLLNSPSEGNPPVIGWIGTSGNLKYVYAIEAALAAVLREFPSCRLRIICDRPPEFSLIDMDRCDFITWSESTEVEGIQNMDIGIMPLEDSAWARGKCSYKMLQYMSCGVPVAVSPVGMNAEVLAMGDIGYGPRTDNEWIEALTALLDSHPLRQHMGAAGRKVITESFSLEKITPRIAACLKY